MKTELKPCPFCGGKAKTGRYYQGESAVYKIYCENCKAKIESNSVDSVRELWNRKAEEILIVMRGAITRGVVRPIRGKSDKKHQEKKQ